MRDRDEGQVMIISIGFMFIALVLIGVITTVTAIQLDRSRLWNLADSAALHAAASLDQGAHFDQQGPERLVTITDESVERAAADYLKQAPPAGSLSGVRLTRATTPDGRNAVIVLDGVSRPGLLGWLARTLGGPGGVGLRVESSARAS